MSTIPFFLIAWVVYVAVAAVVVSPVVYCWRRRVHWHSWELLSLVLPFAVWTTFMIYGPAGAKSLSNLVIEPGILAITLALAAMTRVAMSGSISERMASAVALIGMCCVAAGVFWIVPPLPE